MIVCVRRLGSSGFADRAPPHLVEETRATLRDLEDQLAIVSKSLQALDIMPEH